MLADSNCAHHKNATCAGIGVFTLLKNLPYLEISHSLQEVIRPQYVANIQLAHACLIMACIHLHSWGQCALICSSGPHSAVESFPHCPAGLCSPSPPCRRGGGSKFVFKTRCVYWTSPTILCLFWDNTDLLRMLQQDSETSGALVSTAPV